MFGLEHSQLIALLGLVAFCVGVGGFFIVLWNFVKLFIYLFEKLIGIRH